jgi:hypothetical protein
MTHFSMTRLKAAGLFAVLLAGINHPLPIFSQGLTGQISGTVLDADGKPVSLAHVTLTNSATGQARGP